MERIDSPGLAIYRCSGLMADIAMIDRWIVEIDSRVEDRRGESVREEERVWQQQKCAIIIDSVIH